MNSTIDSLFPKNRRYILIPVGPKLDGKFPGDRLSYFIHCYDKKENKDMGQIRVSFADLIMRTENTIELIISKFDEIKKIYIKKLKEKK